MTAKRKLTALSVKLVDLSLGDMPVQGYSVGARRLYHYLRTTNYLYVSHLAFKEIWKKSPGMDFSKEGYLAMIAEVDHFVDTCIEVRRKYWGPPAGSVRKPTDQVFRWE